MITNTQFQMFDSLYSHYNNELFGGKLKDCMIITSRKKGARGFFRAQNWKNRLDKKYSDIHEISLNPDYLDRPDMEWQSTLVHEMVHLWQHDYGKPPRNTYHNLQWAYKMEEIGLMPSSTGQPGGMKTGYKMSDYIIPDGPFIKAFNSLVVKQIKYVPSSEPKDKETVNRKASKTKYKCPCGNNIWGRQGLFIVCATCNQKFEQQNEND